MRFNFLVLCIAGFAGMASLAAGPAPAPAEVRQGFDLQVPEPPAPLRTSGGVVASYEVHLTNFAAEPLAIERVRVVEPGAGQPLLELAGERLSAAMGHVGPTPERADAVPPGSRAVLYLSVPLVAHGVPAALRHIVEYRIDAAAGTIRGSAQGEVLLGREPLPVLSPPLRGGPWIAVYDPTLERGHRRVVYAVGGQARIPGRFAIDWMPAGRGPAGARADGLGAEVLAVADGIVVSTRDGVPEPAPDRPRPRASLAEAAGNFVVIDIGHGRFAQYEHLMPGLRVRPGQRVSRGQAIGRLGSTGQASRPHLHFHLADASSTLDAEGQPYLLAGARRIGTYGSIAEAETGGEWEAMDAADEPSFPGPNSVMMLEPEDQATGRVTPIVVIPDLIRDP